MPLHIGEFRVNNVFGRKICWNSLMRSGILFASAEILQRPRSDFSLNLDVQNIWQIVIKNASAQRLSGRHHGALAACLPRQDHVYFTIDESFRFHKNEFDELPSRLDPNENLGLFEKYLTPP